MKPNTLIQEVKVQNQLATIHINKINFEYFSVTYHKLRIIHEVYTEKVILAENHNIKIYKKLYLVQCPASENV